MSTNSKVQRYGAGVRWRGADRLGPHQAHTGGTWVLDGENVTLDCYGTSRSMDELAALIRQLRRDGEEGPSNLAVSCYADTPDSARAAIIAAGWPLPFATQAAQEADKEQAFQAYVAKVRAEQAIAQAPQDADENPLGDSAGVIAPEMLLARRPDGHMVTPIRIKSVGFGVTSREPIEDVLPAQGAIVHYAQDAKGEGYVGTWAGAMTEICYTLAGERWYMYVALSTSIDDWQQEWWVSHVRLSANAAADAIGTCRKMLRRMERHEAKI